MYVKSFHHGIPRLESQIAEAKTAMTSYATHHMKQHALLSGNLCAFNVLFAVHIP